MSALLDSRDSERRFAELAEVTYKKVYNLAYRLSLSRQDAEDLTQEAYLRAWRRFHDYQGDRPFENWIFRIVTRLFLDLNRARRRRVQTISYDAPRRTDSTEDALTFETADPNSSTESNFFSGLLSEDLQHAMCQLSDDQRLIVVLADVEQMPYAEIAEVIQIPVGTVRSRLHRAHKRLRELLTRTRQPSGRPFVPSLAPAHG